IPGDLPFDHLDGRGRGRLTRGCARGAATARLAARGPPAERLALPRKETGHGKRCREQCQRDDSVHDENSVNVVEIRFRSSDFQGHQQSKYVIWITITKWINFSIEKACRISAA